MSDMVHYILVKVKEIIDDCVIPRNAGGGITAGVILGPTKKQNPGSAIYIRLGNEEPQVKSLFVEN